MISPLTPKSCSTPSSKRAFLARASLVMSLLSSGSSGRLRKVSDGGSYSLWAGPKSRRPCPANLPFLPRRGGAFLGSTRSAISRAGAGGSIAGWAPSEGSLRARGVALRVGGDSAGIVFSSKDALKDSRRCLAPLPARNKVRPRARHSRQLRPRPNAKKKRLKTKAPIATVAAPTPVVLVS